MMGSHPKYQITDRFCQMVGRLRSGLFAWSDGEGGEESLLICVCCGWIMAWYSVRVTSQCFVSEDGVEHG